MRQYINEIWFNNISITQDDIDSSDRYDKITQGQWSFSDVNHNLLFGKYSNENSHFAPHTDGCVIVDYNTRSFYSIIIFLNSIPIEFGGSTRFYEREALDHMILVNNKWTSMDSYITHEIEAKAGRCLIFHQSLVHEGVQVKYPYNKIIIRSDVIHSRIHPIACPHLDEAYSMYRNAEVLSENGKVDESILLFRRAFKLCPYLNSVL